MANTRLTRTNSGNATEVKKGTISLWFKATEVLTGGSDRWLIGQYTDGNAHFYIYLRNSGAIGIYQVEGGSTQYNYITRMIVRDNSAWYHLVLAWDTTVSTATERTKLYINGERITTFETQTNIPQNYGLRIADPRVQYIGGVSGYGTHYNGLMSHVHYADGTQYAPTVFGSVDSVTGEWQINTSPSFTPGNHGFTILKDGNTITDQSANSNNWSLQSGTITNTKDCPSNVMATMNPLAKFKSGAGITQGNNTVTMTTAKAGVMSTIGIPNNKGKFYAEFKMTRLAADSRFHFGILPFECLEADDPVNAANKGIMLSGYNAAIYAGGGNINAFYGGTGRFNSFTGILGIAVDLTSSTKTIAFSKDGAWITGSNATNANYSNALKVNITSYLSISPHWHIGVGSGNSSGTTGIYTMNFGNGFFGTTAITTNSGNGYAGAEGASKFNYAVPSGYSALNTKGLNQ